MIHRESSIIQFKKFKNGKDEMPRIWLTFECLVRCRLQKKFIYFHRGCMKFEKLE